MMHRDIGTTNAVVAAQQENVARMLKEGQRPGPILLAVGSLLVRLGEWLRRDVEISRRTGQAMPTRARRPQVA